MKKQENRRVKVLVSIVSQADEAKLTEVINGYATAMHFSVKLSLRDMNLRILLLVFKL